MDEEQGVGHVCREEAPKTIILQQCLVPAVNRRLEFVVFGLYGRCLGPVCVHGRLSLPSHLFGLLRCRPVCEDIEVNLLFRSNGNEIRVSGCVADRPPVAFLQIAS